MYHIHSLYQSTRLLYPSNCELPVNFTIATTEEPKQRFKQLYDSFLNFDGFSTVQPTSDIPRIYQAASLHNQSAPLKEIYNFSSLIKAASFVASNCHSNRNNIVQDMRKVGFRVDGLGRCMRSHNLDGAAAAVAAMLSQKKFTDNNAESEAVKRKAIGQYAFNCAFESWVEPGYATEKPFDALIAGKLHSFVCIVELGALSVIIIADSHHTQLGDYIIIISNIE
jgi:hypothetical protein